MQSTSRPVPRFWWATDLKGKDRERHPLVPAYTPWYEMLGKTLGRGWVRLCMLVVREAHNLMICRWSVCHNPIVSQWFLRCSLSAVRDRRQLLRTTRHQSSNRRHRSAVTWRRHHVAWRHRDVTGRCRDDRWVHGRFRCYGRRHCQKGMNNQSRVNNRQIAVFFPVVSVVISK